MRAIWLNDSDTRERRRREASVQTTVLGPGDVWVASVPHDVTAANPDAEVDVNITGK